jgi:hypothetical protein
MTQRTVKGKPQPFEIIGRLDKPSVDDHRQTERFGNRRRGFQRALQR